MEGRTLYSAILVWAHRNQQPGGDDAEEKGGRKEREDAVAACAGLPLAHLAGRSSMEVVTDIAIREYGSEDRGRGLIRYGGEALILLRPSASLPVAPRVCPFCLATWLSHSEPADVPAATPGGRGGRGQSRRRLG